MTTPVASTSQPAQLPALDAPHNDAPAKKGKDKKAKEAASGHPLEVRRASRCLPLADVV